MTSKYSLLFTFCMFTDWRGNFEVLTIISKMFQKFQKFRDSYIGCSDSLVQLPHSIF